MSQPPSAAALQWTPLWLDLGYHPSKSAFAPFGWDALAAGAETTVTRVTDTQPPVAIPKELQPVLETAWAVARLCRPKGSTV